MSVYENLEFRHLRYIVAIAEEGTFTAAAVSLPVAQSALSRQIGELEEALDIQIFARDHGGSTLTDTGEALLGFARQLLQTRVEVVNAVQAIEQATLRPFRLGFTPFVEHRVLETVCRAYRDLFPKGDIIPENGDTDHLLQRLEAGELDVALVTLPLARDGFCVQAIMHEPLVVCIRKDDPLAQHDSLPPDELSGRLAIFSDPRHHPQEHARLLGMLEEQGIKPRISDPIFNADHVQWMVMERLCVALIRQREVLNDELATRPIRGVHWTIDSAIVYQPEHQQMALPLLLRDLEKRFSVADPSSRKKAPQRVRQAEDKSHTSFG